MSALLRRLIALAITLWAVHLTTFLLLRAAKGGPFDEARSLPPEVEVQLRAEFHLDDPLLQQYLRALVGALRGDFGPSLRYREVRVTEILGDALPVSLGLGLGALVLALLLGIPAGLYAALAQRGPVDGLIRALATLLLSVPNFVIAGLAIAWFSFGLGWFPPAGGHGLSSFVLPCICLALPTAAQLTRLSRSAALEVIDGEGPRAALARGLEPNQVRSQHVLKPALAPILAFLGPTSAALLTGSLVIEQVFALPGLGTHFVQAALNRDYTLAVGITVCYTALLGALTLLADWAMSRVDPRVEALSG
ncbi:MAG: ABC transporter permease [Planctomycetes bacterium]|nr:ABC transporter permease [Planctomycetota bacterium]